MNSEWKGWGGAAHRPDDIKATDRVFLRYRDGTESKIRVAGDLRWLHEGLCDDILEYRFSHPVEQVEPQ